MQTVRHNGCVFVAAFIRKVYGILVCQLSVTALFITLFLFVYVLFQYLLINYVIWSELFLYLRNVFELC